ncbi:myb-like protein X isoform X1 [Vespa mandarinia]|uniref:myb-like protein X isoform X1 n=2 Tax=Vespa mandarinia TaxID=7446 RepID=UPI00161609C5|nr:myb-like protein X isoform X1 [Vespa mandarinia]
MSRSIRDSDEDVEMKTGRRTRTGFGPTITDSPVRRSSRNKQSTKQSGSSPDLSITEISAQGSRTFRTRAGTADSNTLETQKRLRSSKNSVDTEFETLLETQPKKMTRRSIATATTLNTPKANTRPRRMTRAGSETISTPTGRTTRKTRASSMDPEPTIEKPVERLKTEVINTPIRAKRRASVLPSQSTLIEEEEKHFPVVELEKILIETDETSTNIISTNIKTPNKELELSKNKSNENNKSTGKMEEEKDPCSVKGPLDDSSESNHMEISETFETKLKSSFDENNTPEKDKYSAANINDNTLTKEVSTDSPHSFEGTSKESRSLDENILHASIEEKEMNSSNKENKCLNISNSVSEQNKSIPNIKNLHQEISITVLDISIKEEKYVENNDNIKLDNSCLIKSPSVSLSDCNNIIKSNNNVNTNEDNCLEEENKSVSMSDTKETPSNEEEHKKNTSTNSTTVTENLDELNTVSYKVLVNEDNSIPKEQSKINDSSNNQIQDKIVTEEEKNTEIVNQNISNIEEINSNDEIKDKANVSVNPKEKLIDISAKEDNCSNDVNATEIPNINNDEKKCNLTAETVSTCKDSNAIQDKNSSNDNQDNMSSFDSSLPTLEFSDDSIKDSANNAKQIELDSTKCLINLQSPKLSTSIPEKIDSSTVAESHDIPEADLPDKEEESKVQSSSNTPVMSKAKSVSELNVSKSKKEKKKNDVQNADESDNISDIRMLFQDISADEWKLKNKNVNIETRSNSMHSISTAKLETDSETECDLLLVDKKAWLAAEKLKASKDKEKFDYDSDDTIILKSKLDYLNDKLNNTNKIEIKSKDSAQDNDNSEIKENMEKSINSSKLSTKETKNELDEVEKNPNKLNDKTDIDKSETDVSSQSASKKEKSRKSISVCNVSRSVLVKSLDKQLEEEEEVSLSQKVFEDQEAKTTVDVINKVEVNTLETKLERQSLDKKQKKNRSLNSSLNKSDKSKQKSNKRNRLNISSSEEEDDNPVNSEKNENKRDKLTKSNGKKRYNKNYSTMVHIGSDSDTCDESIDSSNSGIRNKTPRIPRFLFKHKDDEEENEEHNESGDESNEDKFSDRSIDSDINAEYNLDGKTIGKFSDDDIPGDECRASESEFSDPDDNGSDLADFVVDDDEIEEGEEEDEVEDEEEDEDEDEEQEEEKENQEIENEEDKKLIENKNEKEIEGTEDTVKSCEEKIKVIDSEEINKESQNKSINVFDVKSDKKKNPKQKVNTEINFSESDEDEIVSESKVDAISELDSNTSGKKLKKKPKLNENNETIDETSKQLNESEMIFTKKVKGTNISLTCSTPKTDILQQQQFNKQNISSNEEQENVRLKDLSSDNYDTSKSTITNSKKKRSIENNISTDLLELLKDANLPKTLLSKKAYLNKTISPCSETPTTKYLKKQKLNDSAPNIKFEKNKNASEKIDFIDDDKDNEQSENKTIPGETTELLELNSPTSIKRKRSAEISDSNDKTELRNKKNKMSSKLDIHTGFDNEKENSENVFKVNDEKKRRKKKNKKNKISKELDKINVATTIEKKNIEKAVKMEVITSNESKKNKKRNKNKGENVENKDKNNEKFMNIMKSDKKSVEIENIPNKKKKITSVLPTLQVKEQLKKSQRKKILKSSTMSSDAKISNETFQKNIEFFKSKYEASEAAKRAGESIKANRDMEKKQRKQLEKIQEKDIKVKKSDQIMIKAYARGIKRLSPDVIENLSDVPMNPFKKTKLFKNPMQQTIRSLPTPMTKNGFTECRITKTKKNYNPSNSGGTTEFNVVNLEKEKKQLKKTSTIVSFRNKMLSRNSRYPVTSYIMYLQKQKVSNKDQCFAKQF